MLRWVRRNIFCWHNWSRTTHVTQWYGVGNSLSGTLWKMFTAGALGGQNIVARKGIQTCSKCGTVREVGQHGLYGGYMQQTNTGPWSPGNKYLGLLKDVNS